MAWQCKQRFMYGVNYAWHHFAGDFGGIPEWDQLGVAADPDTFSAELADMRAHGVSVVRWWLFPDFRGKGVAFDANDNLVGLGATTLADLEAALQLAELHDLYLMPCLFSFDGFRATRDDSGVHIPGLQRFVVDDTRRAALMSSVVAPVTRAVAQSAHAARVMAWDVINEPEWAVSGTNSHGDPPFDPNADLQVVTPAQMERFITDAVATLHAESTAPVTVGSAAVKWANAWKNTGIDFYQFHTYAWVDAWWPYAQSPADNGVADRPVVMGEFPMGDLGTTPYATVVESWFTNGYAGALSWQYNEADATALARVQAFADAHPCQTRY
ncbi:MAG: hypothetical protein HY904_00245 [Deltaproteobacteria bacterium]|nr:hypothetical protein [Deltaproteobacteria bacterium]